MTIEEAREFLDNERFSITLEYSASSSETQKKRLNEKFSALNAAIEAIEKQIPKKVVRLNACPICGVAYVHSMPYFCGDCGQALDWSVDEPSKPKRKRMFTDEQIERICWEIEQVNKEQREKEND